YPHPDERTQRDKFHRALIRRTLNFRMESDPKWAQSLTSIRPAYLSVDDQHEKTFSAGQERIHRRSTVAAYVVMPHLETLVSGVIARRNGFVPTTKNMILQATYALGLSEN